MTRTGAAFRTYALVEAMPWRVRTVLTDNSSQSADTLPCHKLTGWYSCRIEQGGPFLTPATESKPVTIRLQHLGRTSDMPLVHLGFPAPKVAPKFTAA